MALISSLFVHGVVPFVVYNNVVGVTGSRVVAGLAVIVSVFAVIVLLEVAIQSRPRKFFWT